MEAEHFRIRQYPAQRNSFLISIITAVLACGLIAFEADAAPFVSGTVYTDEGSTSVADGTIVRLVVNGSSAGTDTTVSGAYSIDGGSLNAGDALLVYIEDNATYKGTTVTVSDGNDLAGLDIYAAHLITRHDNSGALSNADMDTAKGSYTDSDILYSVSSGELTVSGSGTELYVPSGHTFTPGGNVSTTNVKILGAMNAGAYTYTVDGDWDSSGGTFAFETSTVILTGTGNDITPLASSNYAEIRFHNLTIDPGANITVQSSFAFDGSLTVSGTLEVPTGRTVWAKWGSAPSGLTVNAGGELTGGGAYWNRSFGNVVQANISGTVSIAYFTYTVWWTGSDSPVLIPAVSYGGNLNIERATSNASDYAVLSGTGPLSVGGDLTISSMNNRDFDGYAMVLRNSDNDIDINVNGDLVLGDPTQESTATFITGNASINITGNVMIYDDAGSDGTTSIDASDGAPDITVSGNWNNNDTFTAGSSTVTFNGTGQAINGSNTFNNLTKSVASADTLTFGAGSITTVNGTATLNGADGQLLSLVSDSPGTQWDFVLGAGAVKAISYVNVYDSDASGSDSGLIPVEPADSIDGGNTVDWFLYQPDSMIKLSSEGDGSYLSNDTYESTASSQVKSQGVVSGSTASYNVRFQNDSSVTDSIIVNGTGSGSGFTVQYLDDTGTDRTPEVTGAGYTISDLASSAEKVWTLNVVPGGDPSPVAGGTSYDVMVTAVSSHEGTRSDQVKVTTSSTSANVTFVKNADKASADPGEEITYTVTATNGPGLTDASNIVVTDQVPGDSGFRVAGGATFNAGTSTLTADITYSDDDGSSWTYTPVDGGCSAPAGYDYCVTDVKWTMTGNMPAGTDFSISLVVRIK